MPSNSSKPPAPKASRAGKITRGIWIIYAFPVLMAMTVVGFLVYNKVTHQPAPIRQLSGTPFQSVQIGALKANFFTQGDVLRAAGDDLFIEFRDTNNVLSDVGKVSLQFALNMSNMVLHSMVTVNKTSTPGQYRTTVQPGMAGEWTGTIGFDGGHGAQTTNFLVKVL